MYLYSCIMFAVAVVICVLGAAIRRGRIELIHDYHRENVSEADRDAYGRAFSVGMFTLGGTMALSGVLGLFETNRALLGASLGVLFAGIVVSVVLIVRAQKRYNGGLF